VGVHIEIGLWIHVVIRGNGLFISLYFVREQNKMDSLSIQRTCIVKHDLSK
jgi:hypothetical protein